MIARFRMPRCSLMVSKRIKPSARNSSNPRPRSVCPIGTSTTSRVVQPSSCIIFSSRCRMTRASVFLLNVADRAVNESMTSLWAFIVWTSLSAKLIVSTEKVSLPGVIMSRNLNLPVFLSCSKFMPSFSMFFRKTFSRSTNEM